MGLGSDIDFSCFLFRLHLFVFRKQNFEARNRTKAFIDNGFGQITGAQEMKRYIAKDNESESIINGESARIRINIGKIVDDVYEVNEGFLRDCTEENALLFISYWHEAIAKMKAINGRYPQKGECFHTKDGELFYIHQVFYDFSNTGYTLIEFDLI